MALVVNTNVSSLNAQRNLTKITNSMSKSLERLSSGLRINHSADDAAGLAIATGMRAQIMGMEQAVRNTGDGLSAIQTADGAIAEQVEILQRMRVLSVQAANGMNSASNLQSIQEEMSQQIEELTRIGNTTAFNGAALINGTFTGKQLQVGANAAETIDLSIGDYRSSGMGEYTEVVGAAGVLAATGHIVGGGDLTINGVAIDQTTDDGVSAFLGEHSGLAKATAINAKTSEHGVTASAGETTLTGTTAITGGTLTAGFTLDINGVQIAVGGDPVLGLVTTANDGTGALRAAINSKSTQTGVTASLDVTGTKILLTAADGRNINVKTVGAGAAVTGFTGPFDGTVEGVATHQAASAITLHSNDDIDLQVTNVNQIGIASALYSVDTTKKIATIDVTIAGGATDSIRRIDSALAKITNEQAKLGAMSNRLEHTMANLMVSVENMTAAESRIRDADFAIETANLTRTQIIQQAGTAMLSQANMRPQAALSLLG